MNEPENSILDRKMSVFWRGICSRCPNCGKGKLFKSYLNPYEACPVCGEDFSKLRVDDGTA